MKIIILSLITGMLGGYLIGNYCKINAVPFWLAAIIVILWGFIQPTIWETLLR